jgi:hypothetical protein
MFNQMIELLSDVPATLAAAWAVWFGAGALLVMWYRKARTDFEMQPAVAAPRAVPRAKSGPRPAAMIAEPRPAAEPRPVAVAVPRPKPTPIVVGDPYGDLATLLDQPAEDTQPPAFRKPGDSPILNSAGSPILRKNDDEPKY